MGKQATDSLTPKFAQMEKDFYEKNNLLTQTRTPEELKTIIVDTRVKLSNMLVSANIKETALNKEISALQAELNVFALDVLEFSNDAELKSRARSVLTRTLGKEYEIQTKTRC